MYALKVKRKAALPIRRTYFVQQRFNCPAEIRFLRLCKTKLFRFTKIGFNCIIKCAKLCLITQKRNAVNVHILYLVTFTPRKHHRRSNIFSKYNYSLVSTDRVI